MEEIVARTLDQLAAWTSFQTLSELLKVSASLRRRSLASMDARCAALSVHAMRCAADPAKEDSFDVVVAAEVGGFYTLWGMILARPGADRIKSVVRVGHQYKGGGYAPRGVLLMQCNLGRRREAEPILRVPQDGVSLRPINFERIVHEGTDGYWAHGKLEIGTDVPAALWRFDFFQPASRDTYSMHVSKFQTHYDKSTYIGFADGRGPMRQLRQISEMWGHTPWEGMSAAFKMDVPGSYQLTLRPFSDEWLIAELSPGDGFSHARIRYLPINRGPYHLVTHIPTNGDWIDSEPPCTLRMTSSVSFSALETFVLTSEEKH